jgi:hypothetical protein
VGSQKIQYESYKEYRKSYKKCKIEQFSLYTLVSKIPIPEKGWVYQNTIVAMKIWDYWSSFSTSPAILIDGFRVFAPRDHFAGQAVPGFASIN